MKNRRRTGSYARGEDTRRRIIETAMEVFASHGYEGATTRVLARRARVTLPAIQYYFGSKEGLYRSTVAHMVEHIETRMAPIVARVQAAIADKTLPRRKLVALLAEMLDAFVALVAEKDRSQCRRLFFARAELETTAPLEALHECARRQIVDPCAALIGRLTGQPAKDERTILRTLAILGQVTMFCNKGARRTLGWSEVDDHHVEAIQALVRQHTAVIFRSIRGAKP